MAGCTKGRTMYVIPFSMKWLDPIFSHVGIEITDSEYVVVNMHIMTRWKACDGRTGTDKDFVKWSHGWRNPQSRVRNGCFMAICNPDTKYIVHYPEERSIVSYGSGYGGNALPGKSRFALRIASVMAQEEGCIGRTHVGILGVESPGERKDIRGAAAFPQRMRKTNYGDAHPARFIGRSTQTTVEMTLSSIKPGKDGAYAINPEEDTLALPRMEEQTRMRWRPSRRTPSFLAITIRRWRGGRWRPKKHLSWSYRLERAEVG